MNTRISRYYSLFVLFYRISITYAAANPVDAVF